VSFIITKPFRKYLVVPLYFATGRAFAQFVSSRQNIIKLPSPCIFAMKTVYFVPITCQCMLATCGANTHRLV